jgi:hypothetical protein
MHNDSGDMDCKGAGGKRKTFRRLGIFMLSGTHNLSATHDGNSVRDLKQTSVLNS